MRPADPPGARQWMPTALPVLRIFTEEEIAELRKIRMWDIVVNATDIQPGEVQHDAFFFKDGDPCPQPQQLDPSLLEPCQFLKGYDYFEVRSQLQLRRVCGRVYFGC